MVADHVRICELEEALQIFCAILTGQPEDATDEEKTAAQARFAILMERMKERL